MSEHTPTPWTYRRAKFPTDGEYDCGISAVIDGKSYCIAEAVGRCAPTINLPAEINAAFIVKAVNNHDELVSTLQFLLEIMEFECVQRGTDMTEPPTPASAIGRARAILGVVGDVPKP